MPLEFPAWSTGKPHSYTATFGLEEGLLAGGASTFVVPGFPPHPPGRDCWQARMPGLAAGRTFDQAWLGLIHAKYPEDFCAWLVDNVPVRVGMLSESLTYTPEACLELPTLAGRKAYALRQIASLGLTHVLCSDERDAAVVTGACGAQAVWFPASVPERCIHRDYHPPRARQAAFFGDLYSEERKRLASHPALLGLLAFPPGPEAGSGLPAAFDALHANLAQALAEGPAGPEALLETYVGKLRTLRKAIFESWMGGLSHWNGLVNLESYFQGYAGRVFEAMAANVPVVSWEVPDRPRTAALFEDGKEILLFRPREADHMVENLDRLHRDPAFSRGIVEAARHKMLAHHTAEGRIRQILAWIREGRLPEYGC